MHEMSQSEYEMHWRDVHQQVFWPNEKIPDQIFREDFRLAFYKFPGIHFDEEFYVTLQRILFELGERHFAIIGDPRSAPKEQFRFVYPTELEWSELTEGEGMQHFHLNFSDEYCILGERGDWGLYSFTVEFGLIIAGYKESAAEAFESRFICDKDGIARWVADPLELTSSGFERHFTKNYLSEKHGG